MSFTWLQSPALQHNMKWAVPRNRAIVKIQNGRQRSTPKTQKNILFFFLIFTSRTFLATWGYAIAFLKMLPLSKFKVAARGQVYYFLCAQNL